MWLHGTTCSEDYVTLWVEAFHSKSPSCQVWWPLTLITTARYSGYSKYNVSRDLARPRGQRVV